MRGGESRKGQGKQHHVILGTPCLKGIPMGLPGALKVVGNKLSKENFKEEHLHGSVDPIHAWSLQLLLSDSRTKSNISLTKSYLIGAGELAQQLRALTPLTEDSGSVLSTYIS